jgi:hypothetical protein
MRKLPPVPPAELSPITYIIRDYWNPIKIVYLFKEKLCLDLRASKPAFENKTPLSLK